MTHPTRLPIALAALLGLAIGALPAQASSEPASPTSGPMSSEAPSPSRDVAAPDHHAEDPSAPAVTQANLYTSERFWPYHVELTRAWKGKGMASPLPAGTRGTVVRVGDAGKARIDFGRHGIGEVPVGSTDLVARADRVRLGTETKYLPNFIEAIGPRLIDSRGEALRPVPMSAVYPKRGFLCVFGDVGAPSFAELAAALGALAPRADLMTIVFPQGRPLDVAVHERLRALDWKVPFVFQHLSEPYTTSLIGEKPELPYVTLQTDEGRMLLAERWHPALASEIEAAITAAFGEDTRALANREVPVTKR